jgi:hypothetical protein
MNLLRDLLEDFGYSNFVLLLTAHVDKRWGDDNSAPVLAYDRNVSKDGIFIQLQNGLSYYHQPFYCPTSVASFEHNCNGE